MQRYPTIEQFVSNGHANVSAQIMRAEARAMRASHLSHIAMEVSA
jgi:hypothetical protein